VSASDWLRHNAAARAPWVPREQPTSTLTVTQAAQAKTAFQRDNACEVCAYRYSRCYPFNHGGDRG
jgi:hypothetical protein